MKNFLFNTKIGVTVIIVVISMITLLLSTTISLLLWGGGRIIFIDLYESGLINTNILDSCTTLWTLLNIVLFILGTLLLWFYLMENIGTKYDTDETTK
jgi:hypothetical protein